MDISPLNQNIDKVFSGTTYYIDFYQRQYKWTDEPVKRLLDDIFYRFNEEYAKYKDSHLDLDKVVSKYSWYYLSTYVTNKIDGKVYVVDGQQRLTTLTLILIALYHLAKAMDSKLANWINNKILGQSGFREEFWMNHEAHIATLQGLYNGDSTIPTGSGITAENMASNYLDIDKWLRRELNSSHRLESFTFYFLHRVVLINLNVEQTDVPMVFEVINDRGVRLKPYEILKGKLLGQVDKSELDEMELNKLWETHLNHINVYWENGGIDWFFIYLLRAILVNNIGDAKKYEIAEYHRSFFNEDANKRFKLEHNPTGVKDFLINDFTYYSELFVRALKSTNSLNSKQPFVYFNELNERDTQLMLIISSCTINDPDEEQKIYEVTYHIDRLFCLLQLQQSYDSNEFAQAIFRINGKIREQPATAIRPAFEAELKALLSQYHGGNYDSSFSYSLFKDTGVGLNRRFKRYFFARVDKFIAENTNVNIKHSFSDLVLRTGYVNGFHIEHILAENQDNHKLFNDDEDEFYRQRNRLGGLLLLKGNSNISSNNETYSKKLKTYANTLYWNETLREDTYKSKPDFKKMIEATGLSFRPMSTFGADELEERHRLLFDISSTIWQ